MLPHGLDVIGEKYPKPQDDSMDTDRTIESTPCGIDNCLLSGGCEILMFEYMNIKFCKLFPNVRILTEGNEKKSEMYIIQLKLTVQHLVYIHRGYLANFF